MAKIIASTGTIGVFFEDSGAVKVIIEPQGLVGPDKKQLEIVFANAAEFEVWASIIHDTLGVAERWQ